MHGFPIHINGLERACRIGVFVTVAGRRTLDRSLIEDKLITLIGDEFKAQTALVQCEKEGRSHERLYVSKINKPLKSAA